VQHFGDITKFQAAGAQNSSVRVQTPQETMPRPVDQTRDIADSFCTSS
jgi:hypothetical protein